MKINYSLRPPIKAISTLSAIIGACFRLQHTQTMRLNLRFWRRGLISLLFVLTSAPLQAAPTSIHLKYGTPSNENLVIKDNYVLSFNTEYHIPNWTAYHLIAADLQQSRSRSGSWKKNPDGIPDRLEASNADYSGSGYDKGHLTPSADMVRSAQAMNSTFVFTNCAPQVGKGFNQGIWRLLEEAGRKWAEDKKEVWIYTGVFTVPDKDDNIYYIGNEIIIPTHWYKIFYAPNGPSPDDDELIAFLMENKKYPNNDFMKYVTTVDEIEKLTGLDFLAPLPDSLENRIEAQKKVGKWN